MKMNKVNTIYTAGRKGDIKRAYKVTFVNGEVKLFTKKTESKVDASLVPAIWAYNANSHRSVVEKAIEANDFSSFIDTEEKVLVGAKSCRVLSHIDLDLAIAFRG